MRSQELDGPILLLLGGNLGDVRSNGEWVIEELNRRYSVVRTSHWYSSPSWGFEGPDFLNKVIEISGEISPYVLMEICQELEKRLGRIKSATGYSDRPMDIDILYFGNLELNEQRLSLPHPKIPERRFTLTPLCEHWLEWVHPSLNLTQGELLANCMDEAHVKMLEE